MMGTVKGVFVELSLKVFVGSLEFLVAYGKVKWARRMSRKNMSQNVGGSRISR